MFHLYIKKISNQREEEKEKGKEGERRKNKEGREKRKVEKIEEKWIKEKQEGKRKKGRGDDKTSELLGNKVCWLRRIKKRKWIL